MLNRASVELNRKLTDYRPDDLIPANEMPTLFSGTTAQTWNALRHKGNGPAYVAVMRRIYYRRSDVEAWIDNNRMIRTDTPAAPGIIPPAPVA
jgi:hypothetical protein